MRTLRCAALIAGLFGAFTSPAWARTHISETGSTLLFPIMSAWGGEFGKAEPSVRVDANATGSGVGISSAMSGFADIGASDAFLTDAQLKGHDLLDVPLAVSAQEIVYNVPELRGGAPLRLSGPILAGIYAGSIAFWDAPEIAAVNPGVVLPHHAILPVRRADGSGDTALFTEYLSLTTPSWDRIVHFGTNVHWPVNKKVLYGTGNAGVVDTAANAAYSIGYLGISYARRAQAEGLEVAELQNRAGAFVAPTTDAIAATAGRAASLVPPDGRCSIIDLPGADSYPLVNFEYAVVGAAQRKRGMAKALRDFLTWIVTPTEGNDPALLASVHFAPLPPRVREIALRQIASIAGP
jgi:phosphate transport system substrate-binding protein